MPTIDDKQADATCKFVLAQDRYNESLRQASVERAARIDAALAQGEAPPEEAHPDPAANAAAALTASPGLRVMPKP